MKVERALLRRVSNLTPLLDAIFLFTHVECVRRANDVSS